MARIKNIELPKDKNIQTGLTRIYGIGRSLAETICNDAKVECGKKVKDLDYDEIIERILVCTYHNKQNPIPEEEPETIEVPNDLI